MELPIRQIEESIEFEEHANTMSALQSPGKDFGARIPSVPLADLPNAGIRSARVILKLCLYRTEIGLTAPTMLSEEHQDLISNQVSYVQKYAQRDWLLRKWVGGSFDVWQDYQTCIDEALISIIPRMFLAPPNDEIPYQSATAFMCSHSRNLIGDLERINDLLLVARTLLVMNHTAQEYVVQSGTDQRVLRLFEICLRVCARSNDSDPNEHTEQVCSAIVTICKSLLGTMMTLLNSMTTSNPARMLCFWVDLFMRDTTEHLGLEAELESDVFGDRARAQFATELGRKSAQALPWPSHYEMDRAMVALGICQRSDVNSVEDLEQRRKAIRQIHSELQSAKHSESTIHQSLPKRSTAGPSSNEAEIPPFANEFPRSIVDLFRWIRVTNGIETEPDPRPAREQALQDAKRVLVEDIHMAVPKSEEIEENDARSAGPQTNGARLGAASHLVGEYPPVAREGKPASLGVISQETTAPPPPHPAPKTIQHLGQELDEEDDDYSDEDDEDDLDDDDERDPYGEAFRRRGIISELPLVLSPNDIMPLCVILQNAVWLDGPLEKYDVLTRLCKAIQCHVLVTQETGKNLLREVLIFVAAWDLAEIDLAYNLIAEVMEAVLYHGLMPIAWHNYRESKDVVSPAQSIIVKILGMVFRQRRKGESPRKCPRDNVGLDDLPGEFAFDRGIIETLLEDFRYIVVPQTVGLIWLQGRIRQNMALGEDFPLNFWEMERVYEGVYQFLELFAVLTETPAWKELFVRQELSFELIALLRELERCIPKLTVKLPSLEHPAASPALPQGSNTVYAPPPSSQTAADAAMGIPGSIPVAVERPYETSPSPPGIEPIATLSPGARLSPGQETLEDVEDPCEFPWRNLKKLVVLVLGSLAYKNPVVKTQVRELGGVELIMKCFEYDEHNPYIREHAVLCLNFLLERSPENQALAMDGSAARAPQ